VHSVKRGAQAHLASAPGSQLPSAQAGSWRPVPGWRERRMGSPGWKQAGGEPPRASREASAPVPSSARARRGGRARAGPRARLALDAVADAGDADAALLHVLHVLVRVQLLVTRVLPPAPQTQQPTICQTMSAPGRVNLAAHYQQPAPPVTASLRHTQAPESTAA